MALEQNLPIVMGHRMTTSSYDCGMHGGWGDRAVQNFIALYAKWGWTEVMLSVE